MKTTILKCVFVAFVFGLPAVTASFPDCCESFKSELERKSQAFNVLCLQKNDTYVPLQSFGNGCCNSSKIELKEKWDAYKKLCPTVRNKTSTGPTTSKKCMAKSMIFKKSVHDYAISKGAPVMNAITACFWVKTTQKTGTAHFITYAVSDLYQFDNHFYVGGQADLTLGMTPTKNGFITTRKKKKSKKSKDGRYFFYKDGKNVGSGSFPTSVGNALRAKGTWVLGQDQDSVGGGFDVNQSLEGELTGVNIWNKFLSKEEILKLSTNCKSGGATGNVKSWAEFMSGVRGDVKFGTEPTCCNLL